MITEITSQTDWDIAVRANDGHPLQLWGWGEVKATHGWSVHRLELQQTPWVGAQVLLKALPGPFRSLAYVPRGPVGKWNDDLLDELTAYVKQQYHSVVLTIEPDSETAAPSKDWKRSTNTILLARTLVLDLTQDDDSLLGAMSKKTRQYIRKSTKEGTTVRRAHQPADIDACLALYKETAKRAQFDLHGDAYYHDIAKLLGDDSPVFLAEHDGEVVAFLWLAASGTVAFELYGGMNDEGQRLRANYTLKWHVIQAMRERGIVRYDFNGLLNDGVSSFKKSFAEHETQLVGTFDKPLSPLYSLWQKGLPLAKKTARTLKLLRK